jgi:DNA-binding NarL/FixJ family response regulator
MQGPSPVIAPGKHSVPPTAALPGVVLVDVRSERLAVMRTLLDGTGLVSVVGEADTQERALEEIARCRADVVVVEIQMPVDAGLATVAALRQRFPDLRIVVCSFHLGAETQRLALENGADTYLAKPVDIAALGRLLRLYATTTRQPVATG